MKFMVNVNFVPGQRDAIAALMPGKRAHVRKLVEQGVIVNIPAHIQVGAFRWQF